MISDVLQALDNRFIGQNELLEFYLRTNFQVTCIVEYGTVYLQKYIRLNKCLTMLPGHILAASSE